METKIQGFNLMNHVKFQRSEKMRHKSPLLPSLEFMTSLCDYFAL
jgi:hypothetical protein